MRKSPINENFDASYISSSVFRPQLSLNKSYFFRLVICSVG